MSRPPLSISGVPVAPLREAFLASGMTASEVADRMGWTRPGWKASSRAPDGPRVTRVLGLRDGSSRHVGGSKRQTHTRYETAVALAEAMGLDPVDVGI